MINYSDIPRSECPIYHNKSLIKIIDKEGYELDWCEVCGFDGTRIPEKEGSD